MCTRSYVIFTLLLSLSLTGRAWAEETKGQPRVQEYQEVERGFWARTNLGAALTLGDVFTEGRSASMMPGPVVSLELGYDFGQVASIHLAVLGQQVIGVRELSNRPEVSNDAGVLALMLGGRFNIITSKRLGWFIKAQASWMLTAPEMAEYQGGLVVQGGTGIEYATQLRHFFIGLEVFGQYDLANSGIGIGLTPTLKYAF